MLIVSNSAVRSMKSRIPTLRRIQSLNPIYGGHVPTLDILFLRSQPHPGFLLLLGMKLEHVLKILVCPGKAIVVIVLIGLRL